MKKTGKSFVEYKKINTFVVNIDKTGTNNGYELFEKYSR
jgi:hypothetical protein